MSYADSKRQREFERQRSRRRTARIISIQYTESGTILSLVPQMHGSSTSAAGSLRMKSTTKVATGLTKSAGLAPANGDVFTRSALWKHRFRKN